MKRKIFLLVFLLSFLSTMAQQVKTWNFVKNKLLHSQQSVIFNDVFFGEKSDYKFFELELNYNSQSTTKILIKINGALLFEGNPIDYSNISNKIVFDITDLVNSNIISIEIKNISDAEYETFYLKDYTVRAIKKTLEISDENIRLYLKPDVEVVAKEDYFEIKKNDEGKFVSFDIYNQNFCCVVWKKQLSKPSKNCSQLISKKNYAYLIPCNLLRLKNQVVADNTPPILQFNSGLETTVKRNFKVEGKASDNSEVYAVFVNQVKANDYKGNFSLSVPLKIGENLITVSVYDTYGNKTSVVKKVIRQDKDTIKPTLQFVKPTVFDFETISNKMTFEGKAFDNDRVAEIIVSSAASAKTEKIYPDINGNFSYQTYLLKGKNTFKFVAKDYSNNFSDPIEFQIVYNPEQAKPKIEILSPKLTAGDIVYLSPNINNLTIEVKVSSKIDLKEVFVSKINQNSVKIPLEKKNAVFKKQIQLPQRDTIVIEISAVNINNVYGQKKFEIIRLKKDEKYPDVDNEIPYVSKQCPNCVAYIVANGNYDTKSKFAPLPYAENDAEVFKQYLINVLGFQDENIKLKKNLNFSGLISFLSAFYADVKLNPDKIFYFYYSGHGDLFKNQYPYLVPIDYNGQFLSLYNNFFNLDTIFFKATEANPKRVVFFIDMCFAANAKGIEEGIIPDFDLNGNILVFTASSNTEAFAFEERNHSLFTYALLKVLKDTKGENIDYQQLFDLTSKTLQQIIIDKELRINQKPKLISNPLADYDLLKTKIP